MKMIEALLQEAVSANAELVDDGSAPLPADATVQQIPTLQPGFYRPLSPMLRARFAAFGAWTEATHGNWLDTKQMEALWAESAADEEAERVRRNLRIIAENWPNDAAALFKPERVSVFAALPEGNERVYLIWFDCMDEPEVWAYDTGGDARHRNLAAYLQAYLDDDLSAYSKPWILGNSPA